jgi:cytochrome c7-like protein
MRARVLLIVAAVVAAAAGGLAARELSRVGVHQGYAPAQPIAFSHRLHAGEAKVPCLYCHAAARTSRHAGIPPVNVCMNCHSMLEKQTVEIERLKEAVQRKQAIAWTKVHNLPDFVYFNHSQHVGANVACRNCHGAVETMDRIRQEAPLTMGWCLDCHRARDAEQQRVARASPHRGLDCSNCHY